MNPRMMGTSSKIVALLAIIGLLGVILLAVDPTLREYAPINEAALIVFFIIDFILAGAVYFKPSRMVFGLVTAWCGLRIIMQIGDIAALPLIQGRSLLQGPEPVFGYADFANYLFNPLGMTRFGDNPPGVPGVFLDLMILLQAVTAYLASKARKTA